MSDERIERALRQGPPNEPAYVPGLHLPLGRLPPSGHATDMAGAARSSCWSPSYGCRALVVAVIGGAFLLRLTLRWVCPEGEICWPASRAAGVIRVAVRPDYPQVAVPGGARTGFDVDVANELGRRLGVRVSLQFVP